MGDATVVGGSGGDGDEGIATAWGDDTADVEFAALPLFVVREDPDAVLDDEALAGDGAVVAPRADAARAEDDDGPDAFDFPLSVEW